ncbi:carboxypeptidase-like regulatory domain-containing protein [Cryomorphaceae bacterium 1068]|nr:carboxypeptidase-like regulatory domain-containing protein [Cryomorphaceae bacterium 1068]
MHEVDKVNLSNLRPCDQHWSDMKRVGEKRLCQKCEKHITDFRKLSSREIALAHAKSETAVCGLYSPDQLGNGSSRTAKRSLIPIASFASLLSLLSPSVIQGQSVEIKTPVEQTPEVSGNELKETEASTVPTTSQQDSIIISGKATYFSDQGDGEPIPFATIMVKGTEIGTTTDFDGNYALDISEVSDSLAEITLVFNYIGTTRQEMLVPNRAMTNVNFDAVTEDNMVAFSVAVVKAPLHKRVWRKMTSVFR